MLAYPTLRCPGPLSCTYGTSFYAGEILFASGMIFALVSWLLGMIVTVRSMRWGWLILIFLLNVVGALIYGIIGPTQPTQHSA